MKRKKSQKKKVLDKTPKKEHGFTEILVSCMIISVIVSGLVTYALFEFDDRQSKEDLIKDFYEVETAAHISPHHIRKSMAKGDESFLLVDLRSQEEYEEEHIGGAINIPAYKDKDHSDYGAIDRIVNEFSKLPKDRDIIVYCYSTPCMTGRKVGKILADHDIYVKHLGIGWNEWRYDWKSWNHPHEWNITDPQDYIQSGKSPGIPKEGLSAPACSAREGELGC